MFFEILLALLIGILLGIFTGLAPGIHINLVALFLVSISPSLLTHTPAISLVIFIVAMTITHSFIDFIPSIYLGAPDEDNFLSVLPGHQMLRKGSGYEATVLTLYGALSGLIIIAIFIPLFIFILPPIHNAISSFLPFLLIFLSSYIIFREEKFLLSLTIFLLAGFLGFTTLNLPINEPMLPLLTGLFGASTLIISLKDSPPKLPEQKISKLKEITLTKKEFIKTSISASIAAPICSFLPGIGSGHAAIIGSEISEQNQRQFLFLVGSINTIVNALSIIALYSLGRTRSGSAVAIKALINPLTTSNLLTIIAVIFITSILSFIIGINLSKLLAKQLHKMNYKYLSIAVLIILLSLVLFFSSFLGLLVFITSISLGIFSILSNSRRINLMGSLLIPTIVFYLTL